MSTKYRLGPANILVASALTDPLSSWKDFGVSRGNAVLDLNARDLALLRTDQEKTPLADAAYITPSPTQVRFLVSDVQLANLLEVFPGSVQLTSGTKKALAHSGFPYSSAKISPKSWAIVPTREYQDDLFFLDSDSVVWFEYAFATVDTIPVANAIEDTDDALSGTSFEVTLTRALPNASGIGNPLLSGKKAQGVLFAWEPSLDGITPLIGEGAGTFTRATTATYTDDDGVIQSAASGEPRYQDGGLLLEPQRTNIATYSEAFSSWSPYGGGSGTTSVSESDPTGGTSAVLIEDTDGAAYRGLSRSITYSATTQYILSVFIKKGSSSYPAVWIGNPAGGWFSQSPFNWTGDTPVLSGWTAEDYGNGWFRVWTTFTTTTGGGSSVYLLAAGDGSPATGSSYYFGIQIEAGSYPTSYIPTSGTTVTRNADQLVFATSHEYDDAEGITIYDKRTPYTSAANPSGWVTAAKFEGNGVSKNTLGVNTYNGAVRILSGFNTSGTANTPSPSVSYADGVEIESTLSYGPSDALKYFSGTTSHLDTTATGSEEMSDKTQMGPITLQHGAQVISALITSKGPLTPAQLRRILR